MMRFVWHLRMLLGRIDCWLSSTLTCINTGKLLWVGNEGFRCKLCKKLSHHTQPSLCSRWYLCMTPKPKTGEAGNTQKGGNTGITAGYEILARIAQLNTYIDITAVTLTGTRRPIYQSPEIGSLAWSTIAWQRGVASYACNMAGMTEIVCVSFKKGAVATVAVIFAGFVIHNEVSVAAITWTHCQPKEIHHNPIGSLVSCIV